MLMFTQFIINKSLEDSTNYHNYRYSHNDVDCDIFWIEFNVTFQRQYSKHL